MKYFSKNIGRIHKKAFLSLWHRGAVFSIVNIPVCIVIGQRVKSRIRSLFLGSTVSLVALQTYVHQTLSVRMSEITEIVSVTNLFYLRSANNFREISLLLVETERFEISSVHR